MKDITKEDQLEAVSGWWNSDQIVKWDKQYDEWDSHTVRTLNRRLEKVLDAVDNIHLPKGAKVLELGYGAGQTALRIGQKGYEIHGIDISEKLCDLAQKRCHKEDPDGKYHFHTGNLERRWEYADETFDLVVASGVFHYFYDDVGVMKEAYRILKPGGHMIIAQRSLYGLHDFTSIRRLCCACTYAVFREQRELFPSFKSVFCESKFWKRFFGRYADSKFFNTSFMLKGHDNWKYKLKKNIYSNSRLKKLCCKSNFKPLRLTGAHYYVSGSPKYYDLNLKVDDFFEKLVRMKCFWFLQRLARITILTAQKRNNYK